MAGTLAQAGRLRSRAEELVVGRRDRTNLVTAIKRQVDLIRAALTDDKAVAHVDVRGVLCFLDGDWSLSDLPGGDETPSSGEDPVE